MSGLVRTELSLQSQIWDQGFCSMRGFGMWFGTHNGGRHHFSVPSVRTPPATSLVEPFIRADSTSSFACGDRDQNLGSSPTNSSPFPPQASGEPGVPRLLRGKSRLSAVLQSPPGASHVSVKGKKAVQGHLSQG